MLTEEGSASLVDRLQGYDRLVGSNLVEAEVKSTRYREGMESSSRLFDRIFWVMPPHPLSDEITSVLTAGYLRGADVWHLATALHYASHPSELSFLTLDLRQRSVAEALGFQIELKAEH